MGLFSFLKNGFGAVKNFLGNVGGKVGDTLSSVGSKFGNIVGKARGFFNPVKMALGDSPLGNIVSSVGDALNVGNTAQSLADGLKGVGSNLGAIARGANASQAYNATRPFFNSIGDNLRTTMNGVGNIYRSGKKYFQK